MRVTYRWVQRVARLLGNKAQRPARQVRRGLSALLSKIRQAAAQAKDPVVTELLQWFLKVTKSYWSGLFRCYESPDIPRTNNDLEHLFGSQRYHERRASGATGGAGFGSARLRPRSGGPGNAPTSGRGVEIADGVCGELAPAACRLGQASGRPT